MGILDLLHRNNQIHKFLNSQELNKDLKALKTALEQWNMQEEIHVGESGTLYRFLQFISWKENLNKKFIKTDTLKEREITQNPAITNFPLKKLLELDNGTSQWASIAVLTGNKEKICNPPYKLDLTYKALEHWKSRREQGLSWVPRQDITIQNQILAFQELMKTGNLDFSPKHSEDYCFARAFNKISKEEGQKLWPSLASHESNRLEEMEKYLKEAEENKEIDSKDHRIVQAIAMLQKSKNKELKFTHPGVVSKSWPLFWTFLSKYK